MARLRLARARVADVVQDEPRAAETDAGKTSQEVEEQQQTAMVPQQLSRSLLVGGGRRWSSSKMPPHPPLAAPSHAALWLSKWPGLASYSSRVARKRCKKGLPPPALPPVILRQATLQKSRSVESGSKLRGPSAEGGSGGGGGGSGSLLKTPSLPSSLLLTPHGRGLVSGGDIFYDARGGSILTGDGGGEGGGTDDGGMMTSEMLRALAAEVELQMAAEEKAKAAAAAAKNSGSKGSSTAPLDVENEGEEELDDEEEDEEEEKERNAAVVSDRASALVLSREPGWHSSLFRPSRRLRQGLPPICETGRRPSMWSLICSLFGKASHDLHSVSVPAHFNEPLTETQRHIEIMQHSHLLDEAAEFPPESPARLLAVFGFACSLVSTCVRTSKPFKDLEGSTFEMVADDDDGDDEEAEEEARAAGAEAGSGKNGESPAPVPARGGRKKRGRRFRALAEKVQHSPPVVAFCVQGEKWTFEAHDELHVELSLRGLKMHPRGACRLTFIDDRERDAAATPTSTSSPPLLLAQQQAPDEYRWNTPAFYVRDIVPTGSPGHMMRVSHKGPFFAKCMATGDAVVAVAAEADPRQARAAAARGRGLMSTVSGRYEPGPGRPPFAAEISGRLDGVVVAKVRREHTEAAAAEKSSGSCACACPCDKEEEDDDDEKASPPPSCSCSCSCHSSSSSSSLLGCDPRRFDGGGGRGFSGHAREALAAWEEGEGAQEGKPSPSPSPSPFVLLPLFRGTTAHHRSQRRCGPWGMSPWACSLNDAPEDLLAVLPVTDARRRKDVALVERGDGDAADAEKERMEARQRVDRAATARAIREWKEARAQERRKRRKERDEEERARREEEKKEKSGDAEDAPPTTTAATATAAATSTSTSRQQQQQQQPRPRPFGTPQWFHSVPGTDVWGNPYSRWVYKGGYWEARERKEWPGGMRDPYC